MRLAACLSIVAALVVAAPPAIAAGPKTIGTLSIAGDAAVSGLPIVAYQWAATVTPLVGGGGLGSGKVGFEPFTVTKLVDGASPALLERTFAGSKLSEVRIEITLRRGTTATYVLGQALIVRDERRVSESGGPALQTLAFQPVSVRETVVSPGGTVTTCWSLDTNTACD
jgi:type VI protein secretion system component Hcp